MGSIISPREPKGAAGDWTEEGNACDERRGKEPASKGGGEVGGAPEASGRKLYAAGLNVLPMGA
jgi:hypothetical protein